jgi:hypothetical protein
MSFGENSRARRYSIQVSSIGNETLHLEDENVNPFIRKSRRKRKAVGFRL